MGNEIINLTYSRSELEKFSFAKLCQLNGIETHWAYAQGLSKQQLVEFLLIPNN